MAYTAISKSVVVTSGLRVDNIGQAGVAGGLGTGHKVGNNGQLYVYVNNSAANTPSITFVPLGTFRGVALTTAGDVTRVAVANDAAIFGPFPPEVWNDADNNLNFYYAGANETELKVVPFQF